MLMVVIASLACAPDARGEAAFSIETIGKGIYAINGTGMADIAALDFVVNYDPAAMNNPRVVKGGFVPGDATFFANTAIAGEVRIMMTRNREIAGSGTLATVSFERVGTRVPRIIGFKSNQISVTAAPLQSQARTVTAPPDQQPADVSSALTPTGAQPAVKQPVVITPPVTSAATTVAAAGGGVIQGKLSSPDNNQPPPATKTAESDGDATADAPVAGPGPDVDSAPEEGAEQQQVQPRLQPKKILVQRVAGVLERFRTVSSESTAAAITALFSRDDGGVTQEPAIALADGTSPETVRFVQTDEDGSVPTFTLEKARMLDFFPDRQGWTLVVLPERGTFHARVILTGESVVIDFPLTVAPPLEAAFNGPGLDLNGLQRFLTERGTDKLPLYDLNNDGVRNYIDDYIFAANVLAAGHLER